ncbi:helix-turn-helix domain-containing protein [Actinoplanes sp. NPDC049596]|uniref:helix-turn-helix domain-containing protein n=1 Tax=unclassified Actinoplanes TaxID=2626549 RepID=UPI00343E02A4
MRDDDIALDPRTLRGLAHPLRVRLLNLLRKGGPSTATRLGEQLGQSSGATSYHLRQLALYGFVVEDAERGTGRERWWRAAHGRTVLTPEESRQSWEVAEGYLRAVAQADFQRTEAAIADLPAMPREWQDILFLSTDLLELAPARAAELSTRLKTLIAEFATDPSAAPAARVAVQWQLLPLPAAEERG